MDRLNHRPKLSQTAVLTVVLAAFAVLFCVLRPKLFSLGTLQSMCYQLPELGILTIGMAVTMIVGGINLSCIASANLSAIVMVAVLNALIPEGGDSLPAVLLAAAAGLTVSMLVGMLNGAVIAFFQVPDILATLSTQMLIGGLNIVITGGKVRTARSELFSFIGTGDVAGIPFPMFLFVLCAVLAALLLGRTVQGKRMYLFGSNATVSRFNGVSRAALIIRTYAISGFFVGIAGIIMTSRFSSASASYAGSYLLQTVLIAVLAGVDPDGGKGKVRGLVVAVALIQVLSTGFNGLRLDSHLSTAILGLILLFTIWTGREKTRD